MKCYMNSLSIEPVGDGFDFATVAGEVFFAVGSFHKSRDFIRVWYVSDSRNVMLVTYVCAWDRRFDEKTTCDRHCNRSASFLPEGKFRRQIASVVTHADGVLSSAAVYRHICPFAATLPQREASQKVPHF